MAFDEVTKSIAWSAQTSKSTGYPVWASLSMHGGEKSQEPIAQAKYDDVTYAGGSVYAAKTPTPHLVGTLTNVAVTDWQTGTMKYEPTRSVSVEIYPDGKVIYQHLRDGKPLGIFQPPQHLQMTDLSDILLTNVTGTQVVTIGVARGPAFAQPPQ